MTCMASTKPPLVRMQLHRNCQELFVIAKYWHRCSKCVSPWNSYRAVILISLQTGAMAEYMKYPKQAINHKVFSSTAWAVLDVEVCSVYVRSPRISLHGRQPS